MTVAILVSMFWGHLPQVCGFGSISTAHSKCSISSVSFFVLSFKACSCTHCCSVNCRCRTTWQSKTDPLHTLAGLASCSDPLPVDPPASFALNPCDYDDSAATNDDDAVMLIGSFSTPSVATVETRGGDTRLFAYTSCPDSDGSSKVRMHLLSLAATYRLASFFPAL